MTVTTNQANVTAPAVFDDGAVGVYLHLPFCERVCPYCDFAVVAMRQLGSATEAKYKAGLLAELEARRSDFPDRALASVYFGGGTPSLFSSESIAEILAAVHDAFPPGDATRATEVETTLELNPSTVEQSRLPDFRGAGINRLSIGVQSFDDGLLKRLGRAHRAEIARESLKAARTAGFENISIDLIFAGPGQSSVELERDLDELLAFAPEHLSTYELTFEPETPFGRALADGKLAACDEDLATDMMLQIETRCSDAGYDRYEISNYAAGDRWQSQHNSRYWRRQAVLGLGMGAHSVRGSESESSPWRAPCESPVAVSRPGNRESNRRPPALGRKSDSQPPGHGARRFFWRCANARGCPQRSSRRSSVARRGIFSARRSMR